MIIVTGGTHGIGRACVERLSARGVVFTGRDRAAGEALAAAHLGAHFVAGDVASEADCRRVIETALDLGSGRLSGLVNNAGLGRRMEFASATAEDWDMVMGVNPACQPLRHVELLDHVVDAATATGGAQ